MPEADYDEWIAQALERIPWDKSPMLEGLRERYGEGFMQRLRDVLLLPLLGYTSARDAEEDLPYGRDVLYDFFKLEDIDWFALVEEITFALFFHWLDYGLSHDPSTLSRNRLRLIFDHTLINKWGRTIADIANLFDHVSDNYHWSHKLVLGLVTVGEERYQFPSAVRLWSKDPELHKTQSELAAEICDKLHERAQELGLPLSSVRVLADKDYCTKELHRAVHAADMTLYASPQPNQKFEWEGQKITTKDLKSPTFPMPWRQSSKLRGRQPLLQGRYARFVVHHPDLGTCVLAVEEYVEVESHEVKRRVLVCTDESVDAVRVILEARKKRWPVEPTFRLNKQIGSYACYQGTKRSALHAHYACGVLRNILLQELMKLSRHRPSLSKGRRLDNPSAVARVLARNVRFDAIYKSESFLRLRRGSLKKRRQNVAQTPMAAG